MGLLSRFNQPVSAQIHSSGLADANDGSAKALSAMRHESFEQRINRDRSRQHIDSYRYASVAVRQCQPLAQPTTPESLPVSRPRTSRIDNVSLSRQHMKSQMPLSPTTSRVNFSEPSSRVFNPYS